MNIIVICLDNVRWDALGCYSPYWIETPNIDYYARFATRLDAAYCSSFPSLPMRQDALTGTITWPTADADDAFGNSPNIPGLLREAGYYTGMVLDNPDILDAGIGESFNDVHLIETTTDDDIPPDYEEDWSVARTMRRARQWLQDHAGQKPFFLWVDSAEIQEEFTPPPYYTSIYDPCYNGPACASPNYGSSKSLSPEALNHLRARYAGEVTLTDRWVGTLFRQIELMGLLRNTCVILTSDHGTYLGEYNRTGPHSDDATNPWPLYDTVARIPMLIWTPWGSAPDHLSALYQPADIMPTVLEMAGINSPACDGMSWVPALQGNAEDGHARIFTSHRAAPAQRLTHTTVSSKSYTAILGREPHEAELYRRSADPLQHHNIAADHPELVNRFRDELNTFLREKGAPDDQIAATAPA